MSTLTICTVKITEIIYILKQETRLLRSGRLDGFQDILDLKVEKIAELESLTAKLDGKGELSHIAPQVAKLKTLARENGIMLESVMHGLKSAQNRLSALRDNEARIGAYDRSGKELHISKGFIHSELIV